MMKFFREILGKALTNGEKYGKIVNCIIIACTMLSFRVALRKGYGKLHKRSIPKSTGFGGEAWHGRLSDGAARCFRVYPNF